MKILPNYVDFAKFVHSGKSSALAIATMAGANIPALYTENPLTIAATLIATSVAGCYTLNKIRENTPKPALYRKPPKQQEPEYLEVINQYLDEKGNINDEALERFKLVAELDPTLLEEIVKEDIDS